MNKEERIQYVLDSIEDNVAVNIALSLVEECDELRKENEQLKERYKNLMCGYKFLKNRVKQGMSNENKNICLIELGNKILREIENGDSNE